MATHANPATSPEQYGLALAVATGKARYGGMPRSVAKEMIRQTPPEVRSRFAKELAAKRSGTRLEYANNPVSLSMVQAAAGAGEKSGKDWSEYQYKKPTTTAMEKEFHHWFQFRKSTMPELASMSSHDKSQLRGTFIRGFRQGLGSKNPPEYLDADSAYNAGELMAEMYNSIRVKPGRDTFLSGFNKWFNKWKHHGITGSRANALQSFEAGFRSKYKLSHNPTAQTYRGVQISHDFEGKNWIRGKAYPAPWSAPMLGNFRTLEALKRAIDQDAHYPGRTAAENPKHELFIGMFPEGISYADKGVEQHGDYKKIAFLPYTSLKLEVYAPKSTLMPEIRKHAAGIQARRGQEIEVTHTGQTRLLGGRQNPAMLQTRGSGWIQESYETGSPEIRQRAAQLRKLGYRVVTTNLGHQTTSSGSVKVTLLDIRPNRDDVYLEKWPPPPPMSSNPDIAGGGHIDHYRGFVIIKSPLGGWRAESHSGTWKSDNVPSKGAARKEVDAFLKENPAVVDHAAARELAMFVENDEPLHRQMETPINKNLATKKAKGVYNHDLAVKGFGHLMEAGAKKYVKEMGSPGDQWHDMFNTATRKEAAEDFAKHFETEYDLGNYDHLLPKKYQKEVGAPVGKKAAANPHRPYSMNPMSLAERHAMRNEWREFRTPQHNPHHFDLDHVSIHGDGFPNEKWALHDASGQVLNYARLGLPYKAPGWPRFRTREAAERFLDKLRRKKRNPDDETQDERDAASLYEDFHGRPPESVTDIEEEVVSHDAYASLGRLTQMRVATLSNKDSEINFEYADDEDPIMVACSPDRKQLYFINGDQSLDLAELGMDGDEWVRDKMVIGVLYEITYETKKGFDKFKLTDYYHYLGEESGIQPLLIYDTLNSRSSVAGGQYEVKDVGIVN